MRFVSDERDFRETSENKEWTVGGVEDEIVFSDKEFKEFKKSLRVKNGNGERVKPVITSTSGDHVDSFLLDFSLLQKILYEHRRYAAADGFSDPEMDVLRAIEFHSADRVGVDEIMEDQHTKEYSESTIYRYLRKLREKGLIEKVRSGVYRYNSP